MICKKQFTAMLLAVCMTTSLLPTANALEAKKQSVPVSTYVTHINPIYQDEIEEQQTRKPNQAIREKHFSIDEAVPCSTIEEAAMVMREKMRSRMEQFVIPYTCPLPEDQDPNQFFKNMADAIGAKAMEHTGVSDEGDYIKWQYGKWDCNIRGVITEDNIAIIDFVFTATYYTTAEEEQQMTAELEKLEDTLIQPEDTDYEKILAVYQYICDNVTYDWEHLEDKKYLRKHTAYGALFDHTAVCQGYAVLFYRMLLDLGIDTRVIAGRGNNQDHGWNIVKLEDAYYNADTTWDAENDIFQYFLKSQEAFPDHQRDAAYDTEEFNQRYPMAMYAFHEHEWNDGEVTQEGSCLKEEKTTYICTICGKIQTVVTKAANGHQEVQDDSVAATCTQDGKTKGSHCAVCGAEMIQPKIIPALGHSWSEPVVRKEPSCQEVGVKTIHCLFCDEMITEDIPKIEHTLTYYDRSEPNCTEDGGYAYAYCSQCHTILEEGKLIPALGHKWSESTVGKEASCEEEGYFIHVCETCGEEESESIPALGHTWDEGVIQREADYMEDGLRVYTCQICGESRQETISVLELPFKDVSEQAYYSVPVKWAISKGVTQGITQTTFDPKGVCTRGQVVTFLWRANGSPKPKLAKNPFRDVQSDEYYYDAVLWAIENGITAGVDENTFAPAAACTRAQAVTFMWRANGRPVPAGSADVFRDLKNGEYYIQPIAWAVGQNITTGMTNTTFEPNTTCTRGHIVTFLYRDMGQHK